MTTEVVNRDASNREESHSCSQCMQESLDKRSEREPPCGSPKVRDQREREGKDAISSVGTPQMAAGRVAGVDGDVCARQ